MKEKRYILNKEFSTRALEDEAGNRLIEGYASVFNQRSKLIFENGKLFYEVIEPRAFDAVLASEELDVILTYQHDQNEPLARFKPSKSVGSLELSVDEYGLKFRAALANTQLGRDTYELVKRGDLFECSFVFTVKRENERWETDEEGNNIRYISEVAGLYDVSIVVNGAYANTDLMAAERSFREQVQEVPETPADTYFDNFYLELLRLNN